MLLLTYFHPLWQILTLLLGFHVMSLGLKSRNMRISGTCESTKKALTRKHCRRGKFFLILYSVGYFGGLASNVFWRQKGLFLSSHAYLASICLVIFLFAGKMGKTLGRQGRHEKEDYDVHAWSSGGGLFLSFANIITGYSLLP